MITVIYYTANRETESFEAQVRQRLVESAGGRWPIISVSQKLIDLGQNICIGEVGACNANAYRQLQIGIEAAKTQFVIAAESDCLYPPEYFDWIPPTPTDCYRYPNVWVMSKWHGVQFGNGYHMKWFSECAQIAGRDYWLRHIENALKGRPQWSTPEEADPPLVFGGMFRMWQGDYSKPIINIKTEEGLRKWTRTHRHCLPEETLPYWGKANDFRLEFWGE